MGVDEARRRIPFESLISEFRERFKLSSATATNCVYSILVEKQDVPVYRLTDTAIELLAEPERGDFLERANDQHRYGSPEGSSVRCALDEEAALVACGLSVPPGAGAATAFQGWLPGDKLRPLVESWPIVQATLGVRRLQAVTFVEHVMKAELIPLYVDDEYTGLYYPIARDSTENLLHDLGTSTFAHDPDSDAETWDTFRVLPADFEKITAAAEEIAGRKTDNHRPDYLDPKHPRYAPKLAAAVQAWLSVGDPKGKHPKGALQSWLRKHAGEFGLVDAQGKPNEQGIEECAKVANWQPVGGAPKTPG